MFNFLFTIYDTYERIVDRVIDRICHYNMRWWWAHIFLGIVNTWLYKMIYNTSFPKDFFDKIMSISGQILFWPIHALYSGWLALLMFPIAWFISWMIYKDYFKNHP